MVDDLDEPFKKADFFLGNFKIFLLWRLIRETLTVEEYGLVIAEAIREIGSVNLVLDGYSVSLRLNSVSFEYFLDLFACKYK